MTQTNSPSSRTSQTWVAIQRNPKSGSGRQVREIKELISELRNRGIRPRLFSRRNELDTAVASCSAQQPLCGIVAAGGDGTLLDLINRHPKIPIAVLPLGTENLCAKYLGIPRSGSAVAKMVAEGHTSQFDIGSLISIPTNDQQGESAQVSSETEVTQRFIVMASIGFDAAVIHHMHAHRQGNIHRLSYLNPIAQVLKSYSYPELRVYVDDDPVPVVGRNVIVANLPSYALGLRVASNAEGNDGLLDVRVLQQGSLLGMFRYLALIYYRRHERVKDVISRQGSQIRIESDQPSPIQIDGDPAGMTPATITIEKRAGELFVPDSFKNSALNT
ncbi:diacylglycerol kinase family protein [Thalassoglobus sp. JC818]|uniref:diacylglycerol/lipid kinase family protein n=1 Tax=Thalassoglobus sp. JC818 TaxID=3232136 RepID=UPI0034596A0B